MSYGLSGKQGEDAQPLFRHVGVVLHAVPVGKLEGQQVAAVLGAHSLRQQQGQAVISCRHTRQQSQDSELVLAILYLRLNVQSVLSALFPSLTFLLCQSTGLADAVAAQIAENGLSVAAFSCQRHFLFNPV